MNAFLLAHARKLFSKRSGGATSGPHQGFKPSMAVTGFFSKAMLVVACLTLFSTAYAQQPFITSRGDNARTGANTNETMLAPANVNKVSFGHLFSVPLDDQVYAQPLYVPDVNIAGQGVHDVVYVVTVADSVNAIDATTGALLWQASMLNGGSTASGAYLPCHSSGGQEGIVSTPAIDLSTNTMYLVAKTVFNGTVYHTIHAIDLGSGSEQVGMGSPVQIAASSTSNQGHVTVFNSLHEKNRPGLLLQNGILYMGFGSNGCNDNDSGWVISYNASNLQQVGAFNTSPDTGLTSIWQTGNGLAADETGNLYIATAESSGYDVANGGQSFSNSILKLSPAPWAPSPPQSQLVDYFTPWSVAYLNVHDLDVSSVGPLVLPDQTGPYPHEVIASGKEKVIYVLNRDAMGGFAPNDSNVIQELTMTATGELMCSPAYWNEIVYFMPDGSPVQSFQLANGLLTPFAHTPQSLVGAHSPSISANGTTNGILWVISGQLYAYDAVSLKLLYNSGQSGTRDKLPVQSHFATQTVADGKVFVATQKSLEIYGLFRVLTVTAGNNQTAQVLTTLPVPIQIVAHNPYTGQPDVGDTVSFSDGNKGGIFNPASGVTDANGYVSTTYTMPKKSGSYTVTVTSATFGSVTATEVAVPSAAVKMIALRGGNQTGASGTVLPNPMVVQVQDINKNPVPGVTVNFTANNGGVPNPTSVITDAKGMASTYLQLPSTACKVTVTASSSGLKNITFPEYSSAGP